MQFKLIWNEIGSGGTGQYNGTGQLKTSKTMTQKINTVKWESKCDEKERERGKINVESIIMLNNTSTMQKY